MAKIRKFDNATAARLKLPPGKQQEYWFENLFEGRSLVLGLSYRGTRTWSALYYDERAKPRRQKLGTFPEMSAKDARTAAREFDANKAIATAKAGTFKQVSDNWLKRHVDETGLRSAREIRRHLNTYVLPKWETRPFAGIRRRDVNELLDEIVDTSGVTQADAVLATIRKLMRWYQSRDEDYTSPIVSDMRRDKRRPDERARNRVLSDDEIRAVWKAAEAMGHGFGAIIRLALLTGQRREKIVSMKWSDIDDAGVWTIATEVREKGNAGAVKLPESALQIINAQPVLIGNSHVFASTDSRDAGHFNSWSQRKAELDKTLPADMPAWVIHDLRRTARTLMARAKVPDHIAELTLGHRQRGIQAVYNRHEYEAEKAEALISLSQMIDRILNPTSKVVPFRRSRRRRS
jgi:integrase